MNLRRSTLLALALVAAVAPLSPARAELVLPRVSQKSTLTQTAWSHDLQTITSQSGSNKFKKQGETTFSKTDSTVAYVNYTLKNGSNTYKLNLIMSKHSGWLVDSVQFEPIRPGTTVQVTPVEKEGE